MSRPLTIGLTGGIASGKSAVERLFRDLGVPTLDADRVARDVVAPGTPALSDIADAFGRDVLQGNGELDRPALRRRVFSDDAARRRLEAITHPRIREAMHAWRAAVRAPYCIISIPLLAEGGDHPLIDRVLLVDTPVETQLARLMARDGIDEGLARRMIGAQASRETRLAIADDVLLNDRDLAALEPTVRELHERYRAAAGSDHQARQR